MVSLLSLLSRRQRCNFQELYPQLHCEICGGKCIPFDVVDFNKCCEEVRGVFLLLAGLPIYYYRCGVCGFCFAPEIACWSLQEFAARIYNHDYALVDPDYLTQRPQQNANALLAQFGDLDFPVRHLDYGSGSGQLSKLLAASGWDSSSYDPIATDKTRPAKAGKFGLITAFEVFEHVPSPRKLMADLSCYLAPEGIILFSTQLSDGHINSGHRLSWWYAAPRNGHISLYSRRSLEILAEDHGFHFFSFSTGYHGLWRDIPVWAEHLFCSV